MSRFPTTNRDGELSNAMTDLFKETAQRLESMSLPNTSQSPNRNAEYDRLLAIYVRIGIYELNKFYDRSA